MKCVYHPSYQVALPPGHPFPMSKYLLLKDQLLAEGILAADDILQPEPLDHETLELVHTHEYLGKLASSGLSAAEQRRLGLPWSEALWQRSRLASAGTLLAARAALGQGLAGNLAGGTHHAFADHGEGFCVLNDVAIAIRKLLFGPETTTVAGLQLWQFSLLLIPLPAVVYGSMLIGTKFPLTERVESGVSHEEMFKEALRQGRARP